MFGWAHRMARASVLVAVAIAGAGVLGFGIGGGGNTSILPEWTGWSDANLDVLSELGMSDEAIAALKERLGALGEQVDEHTPFPECRETVRAFLAEIANSPATVPGPNDWRFTRLEGEIREACLG